MKLLLRDLFSQWRLDIAGEEDGNYTPAQLLELVQDDLLEPKAWVRHRFTRRFALVGEVLYENGLISQATFDIWVPKPSPSVPAGV